MGQFTGLFNGLDKAEPKAKAKANSTAKRNAVKQAATATEETPAKVSPTDKSRSDGKQANENAVPAVRTRGKRSHPDYTQAPAFVRKDTYKAVKIALLNDERGLDYSDLVQELLSAWLTNTR